LHELRKLEQYRVLFFQQNLRRLVEFIKEKILKKFLVETKF
jgi:hypothetical protein